MPNRSSGEKTATGSIVAGPAILKGVHIYTDDTNDGTVVIDDSTDGSGTVKLEAKCHADNDFSKHINLGDGIIFETGIYVTLSGTGATFSLDYVDS